MQSDESPPPRATTTSAGPASGEHPDARERAVQQPNLGTSRARSENAPWHTAERRSVPEPVGMRKRTGGLGTIGDWSAAERSESREKSHPRVAVTGEGSPPRHPPHPASIFLAPGQTCKFRAHPAKPKSTDRRAAGPSERGNRQHAGPQAGWTVGRLDRPRAGPNNASLPATPSSLHGGWASRRFASWRKPASLPACVGEMSWRIQLAKSVGGSANERRNVDPGSSTRQGSGLVSR